MPNSRTFLKPTPPTHYVSLRSRLYAASATAPRTIAIQTRCLSADPQDVRYPIVEGILDGVPMQPHVHDVVVELKHGRRTTHFRVFFKRHRYLADNVLLDIKGDLVVMRVSATNPGSVVNLRSGDSRLIDYVTKKIPATILPFQSPQRVRLPSRLTLVRSW
ncbi:hypothetical protein DFH06DRAFT_1147407 [Mycena polygramma]|nr:hypothetical protein DFH06DRAFT_1147407 [Mycena polygramma]